MKTIPAKIPYKPLTAVMAGGVLEFYDLIIFGILASRISPLFFPMENKFLSILAGYLTFAIGYFFRPLGSIFFGHIGDRFGRRTALYSCLLLMSIATLSMGILPTYHSIGIAAPLLIIIARILQGFSAGGELAGGLIFIIEHTHRLYTGLVAGLVWSGCNGGVLLGSLIGLIFTLPNMPQWAWRAPFILGFFIALAGLYVRWFLPETPAFIESKRKGEIEKIPLLKGLKCFHKQIICSMLITIFFGTVFFFNIIALPQILIKSFALSESLARLGNISLLLFMTIAYPIFGFCADRFEKVTLAKISVTSLLLLTMIGLHILHTKTSITLPGMFIYHIVIGIVMGSYTSICQIFIIEAFKETIRYSCFGISYSIGIALAGTSPFFTTLLMKQNHYLILFLVALILGTLSLLSVHKIKQLKN